MSDLTADQRAARADELYAAAKHAHDSGDFHPLPNEVGATQKALSDLLDRCRGREMTRDEKRLLHRYGIALDAAHEPMLRRYRMHRAEAVEKARARRDTLESLGA